MVCLGEWTPQPENLNANHIAISVDNIEKAAKWYGKHFGFRRICDDIMVDGTQGPRDFPLFRMYGDKLNKVRLGFMMTGNGVGLELFEFIDPPVKRSEYSRRDFTLEDLYQRGGLFHIAFTASDPEAVARQACEDGAVRVGETIEMGKGVSSLYLRDPWGIVIEILSCNYEQMMSQAE